MILAGTGACGSEVGTMRVGVIGLWLTGWDPTVVMLGHSREGAAGGFFDLCLFFYSSDGFMYVLTLVLQEFGCSVC